MNERFKRLQIRVAFSKTLAGPRTRGEALAQNASTTPLLDRRAGR